MTLQISDVAFVAFLLAAVRAGAWAAVSPPFNHQSIPLAARAGLTGALALGMTPWLSHQIGPSLFDTPALMAAIGTQLLAGIGLGVLVRILMSAVQSAGSSIDLFGGFSISMAYDPFGHAQAAIWGRFYDLLTVVLLFAIDGHVMLVQGFINSFRAVPLRAPALNHLAAAVLNAVSTSIVAAVEIAAPLVAVLFLAQVVMGMVSRAAPSMNILSLSFPFMILLTILLASATMPALDTAVKHLLQDAGHAMAGLTSG